MNAGEGRELRTVAEIDDEIGRLKKARDDYERQLSDRRIRRQQLLGRAAETWRLPEDLIQGTQSLAGDEAWLFEADLMQADGWKLHEGQWTLPEESRSR